MDLNFSKADVGISAPNYRNLDSTPTVIIPLVDEKKPAFLFSRPAMELLGLLGTKGELSFMNHNGNTLIFVPTDAHKEILANKDVYPISASGTLFSKKIVKQLNQTGFVATTELGCKADILLLGEGNLEGIPTKYFSLQVQPNSEEVEASAEEE